jgi:hypothetical protein
MRFLEGDSATSLAEKVRKRKLPWTVTEWHINQAEDRGDVEYLKDIYRQQEEEKLPFIADTTASPGDRTQPATMAVETPKTELEASEQEAGSNSQGESDEKQKPTFTLSDVMKFVQLPKPGQTVAQFSDDLARKLSKVSELDPDNGMFQKDHKLVTIRKNGSLSFEEMTPVKFISWADRRAIIGRHPKKEEQGGPGFYKESMSESLSRSVLAGDEFINTFPVIGRILDVPIPVRNGKEIIYPRRGYNRDLELYCDSKISEVNPLRLADGSLDLERARRVIEQVHEGFAFADEQSKTHAVARLFTPYCRGLMGFSAKTPLWFYEANRPGVGKDYLAGITQTVYLGTTFEDAALSKNQEETAKRISSALRSGRRQMHFANCQHHLDDQYLTQTITNQTFNYRSLGSNTGNSDLKLPNELDISISANMGLTYREDLERRFRKIRLECFEENINSRKFPNPQLQKWVANNRGLVLSAIATFVQHWIDQGEPAEASTFASFYEWSRVVGGILVCGGFGDPCQETADRDEVEAGGDLKTKAMGSLASLAYDKYPNEWIGKGEVYELIGSDYEQGAEDLHWFGDPTEMGIMGKLTEKAIASRTRISMALKSFHRRLLRGVRVEVQKQSKMHGDVKIRFTKPGDAEQTSLNV